MDAPLTVGDLRKALEGVPDDLEVVLEIATAEEELDLAQADLRTASVEERCDDKPCLYLWGSQEEDIEELTEGA